MLNDAVEVSHDGGVVEEYIGAAVAENELVHCGLVQISLKRIVE